jgi:chorismate dehydratase
LRIGRIPYLNLFPFYYWFEHYSNKGYQFIEGVPSEVNRLLRIGMLDISPSSSIEYIRGKDRYLIVPGHSISSRGAVKSILLFSKKPIENLNREKILVTYQSESSVLLLKIILTFFYSLNTFLEPSRDKIEDALSSSNAYLLIGDDALRAAKKYSRESLYIYDLGELWYKNTGVPFVFALWIANHSVKESIEEFRHELDSAREWAMSHLELLASECRLQGIMTKEELIQYWKGLSYELDEEHIKGLQLFEDYLRRIDESPPV